MHKYTIRLLGDCLVEVEYKILPNGMLGAPQFPADMERTADYAQLHPYWVSELAYTYKRGYNNAIVQESHRDPQRG